MRWDICRQDNGTLPVFVSVQFVLFFVFFVLFFCSTEISWKRKNRNSSAFFPPCFTVQPVVSIVVEINTDPCPSCVGWNALARVCLDQLINKTFPKII